MDLQRWQARAVVTYLSWALSMASVTWTQWWNRALSQATGGSSVAACPELPREPVTFLPWTMSLHLPAVAARWAVVDPEVRLLEGEPAFGLRQGMEVTSVRLPNPMTQRLPEGLCFTSGDGA